MENFNENIHPCKGCEDYIQPDGCKSNGGCSSVKVTKVWLVYGREGHRQRESFCDSYKYDFSSDQDGTRILEVYNSDKTGTNDFTMLSITRDTAEDCYNEFWGQLTDGIFENSCTGKVIEIPATDLSKYLK